MKPVHAAPFLGTAPVRDGKSPLQNETPSPEVPFPRHETPLRTTPRTRRPGAARTGAIVEGCRRLTSTCDAEETIGTDGIPPGRTRPLRTSGAGPHPLNPLSHGAWRGPPRSLTPTPDGKRKQRRSADSGIGLLPPPGGTEDGMTFFRGHLPGHGREERRGPKEGPDRPEQPFSRRLTEIRWGTSNRALINQMQPNVTGV